MRIRPAVLVVVVALVVPGLGGAEVIPEAVPDLPVLGSQVLRGAGLVTSPAPPVAPTPKAIDGSVSDWTGDLTRLGGTSIYSRGEFVYQDYLMDDRGADDGEDEQRVAVTDPAAETEPRAYRAETLAQALGEQFGADDALPRSIAAPAYYGDAKYPPPLRDELDRVIPETIRSDHADIEEVRIAADASRISLLVRTTGMTAVAGTAILVLVDDAPGGSYAVPGGLTSEAEWAFLAAGDRLIAATHQGSPVCHTCIGAQAATGPEGFTNAVEIALPRALFGGPLRFGVAAGVTSPSDPETLASVAPSGAAAHYFNVAFRSDEPQRIWMDHDQSFALRAGNVDRYLVEVDLGRLESGYTETFQPRPGYWERVYETDSPVNQESESGQYYQGAFQHYGLYLPTAFRPGRTLPATWWFHYRGGHAHDAAAWVPGLIRQFGEQRGNIVVTPGARGTSTWYVGRGHEDFLDVWDDVMSSFSIDPDRVYLSGYSMGGWASWLLGFLYPDRWAAVSPQEGPPTQGLWLGAGPATGSQNGGNAEVQLTFPLIENARNLPYGIYQGLQDELVPWTGVARMATRFTELGYRNRLYSFPGEHYTSAIYDEWTEAARYFDRFRRDPNPPRVTYRVIPAFERTVETINTPVPLEYTFDGAYWVDELAVRDGDPTLASTMGTFDGTTFGRGVEQVLPIPEAGTAGQVVPYVMTGLRWEHAGATPPSNRFEATLANLATARLDLGRMGVATGQVITAIVTTDGPAELRLAGVWGGDPVVTGAAVLAADGCGCLRLGLESAGTHAITIAP